MTHESEKEPKRRGWKTLRVVLLAIRTYAPTLAALATVCSAGLVFWRAETAQESRFESLDEQLDEQVAGTERQVETLRVRINALEEAVEQAAETQPTQALVAEPFLERNRVRCPGGGDWLSRNRNHRTGSVTYEAPEGAWVAEAHTRTLADNSGDLEQIVLTDFLDGDRNKPQKAQVEISCDPPDFPGAPGGWMEVELYGTLARDSTEG